MDPADVLWPADTPTDMLLRTIERLRPLEGSWRGEGRGQYPTLDDFAWKERLDVRYDGGYPMLALEQTTRLMPDDLPGHWETGFLRPVADGVIDFSNTQDSGRVEVLRCTLGPDDRCWRFVSVALAHDPRLVATEREFRLDGDRLDYRVSMSTRTTDRPEMLLHLTATLRRA